jgi:hypothetical protein
MRGKSESGVILVLFLDFETTQDKENEFFGQKRRGRLRGPFPSIQPNLEN